jgi:hypothetical protein
MHEHVTVGHVRCLVLIAIGAGSPDSRTTPEYDDEVPEI